MFEYDEFGNLVPMTTGRGGIALPSRTFGKNLTSNVGQNVGSYLGSNHPYVSAPQQVQQPQQPMGFGAAQYKATPSPLAPFQYTPPPQAPAYAGQGYSQPAPAPLAGSPPAAQQPLAAGAAQTVGGALAGGSSSMNILKQLAGPVAGVATKANPYLAAGTLAVGALSTIGGLVGLAKTKKPEKYSLDPKIQGAIGESESAARYGLSDTQLAAARQSQSQNVNSAMYNARNTSAGSGSRAVFGALQGMNMNAGNNRAMSDFNAQQGKIRYRDQMYGQMQTIRDRNTAQSIDTYNRKQQAYGGALQSGLTNMSSYFNLGQAMRYNPTSIT